MVSLVTGSEHSTIRIKIYQLLIRQSKACSLRAANCFITRQNDQLHNQITKYRKTGCITSRKRPITQTNSHFTSNDNQMSCEAKQSLRPRTTQSSTSRGPNDHTARSLVETWSRGTGSRLLIGREARVRGRKGL